MELMTILAMKDALKYSNVIFTIPCLIIILIFFKPSIWRNLNILRKKNFYVKHYESKL